jgi:uncharacterized protein involved in response to NO
VSRLLVLCLSWRRSGWAGGLLAAVVLSGCSAGAGPEQLLTPAQDALSASSSAVLALDLLDGGRLTSAVTQVALQDAVDQLASDEQTVLGLSVSSPGQEPTKAAVVEAIHRAATAAGEAGDAVATSTSTQAGREALKDATTSLTGLTQTLQAAR